VTTSPHLHLGAEALSHQAKAGVGPIPKAERKAKGQDREVLYTFGGLPVEIPACFLAQFTGTPCGGRMERAHLIREQTIRREVSRSKLVLWAPAVWRPACHVHHGELDQSKKLRLPRSAIPAETEAWAAEHGLAYWLDREYGERAA
jgi:hypothetical protein